MNTHKCYSDLPFEWLNKLMEELSDASEHGERLKEIPETQAQIAEMGLKVKLQREMQREEEVQTPTEELFEETTLFTIHPTETLN